MLIIINTYYNYYRLPRQRNNVYGRCTPERYARAHRPTLVYTAIYYVARGIRSIRYDRRFSLVGPSKRVFGVKSQQKKKKKNYTVHKLRELFDTISGNGRVLAAVIKRRPFARRQCRGAQRFRATTSAPRSSREYAHSRDQ